jgi:hypothetical protein
MNSKILITALVVVVLIIIVVIILVATRRGPPMKLPGRYTISAPDGRGLVYSGGQFSLAHQKATLFNLASVTHKTEQAVGDMGVTIQTPDGALVGAEPNQSGTSCSLRTGSSHAWFLRRGGSTAPLRSGDKVSLVVDTGNTTKCSATCGLDDNLEVALTSSKCGPPVLWTIRAAP